MPILLALLLAAGAAPTLYQQAMSAHQAGNYAASVKLYDQAWEQGERVQGFAYNRACAESRAGLLDQAYQHLEQALKNGVGNRAMLEKDDDLANLRRDRPRFEKLLAQADAKPNPCKARPHAMAFWVGEWDVYSPQGQKVGESAVQQILSGCVVLENWTDSFGGQGKSFNAWDARLQKWRQTWVDDTGRQTDYVGEVRGKDVVYEATSRGPDGKDRPSTMTFSQRPDGSVSQLMTVEGQPPWEGVYRRKGVPQPGGK